MYPSLRQFSIFDSPWAEALILKKELSIKYSMLYAQHKIELYENCACTWKDTVH